MTDKDLLHRARLGDQKAFTTLVQRYESRVAATVKGMLGNTDESEDIGQEVFIRFYHALHAFREEASLGTYLTRIAINLSLDELKRRKRKFLFFIPLSQEISKAAMTEKEISGSNDLKENLQNALQKLAPEFRAVLVLRLIDGYSTEETAKLLNLPVGTVLSRLARAQQKLRGILKPLI
ncbi:MAG: sigma-70 family RNA polymerase sigma factor [Bacteroidota bacterium]